MKVDVRRVRSLNDRAADLTSKETSVDYKNGGTPVVVGGPVMYWMSRDQRVSDNWALLYAQQEALVRKVPLLVVFTLFHIPERASERHYDFMLTGLAEVAAELADLNIPFFILKGKSEDVLPDFVKKYGVGEVVVDFSPLRYARSRRTAVASQLPCLLTEVDAHNIIPCWLASDKEEFAAYTFRPKVRRLLAEFLTPFPKVKKHPYSFLGTVPKIKWDEIIKSLSLDSSISKIAFAPGAKAGKKQLASFIKNRLDGYDNDRNDPNKDGVSSLSPYLHFGQLSAQWVALEVSAAYEFNKEARDAFLEELIVRRELADNYCFYNKDYDKVAGAHAWAQKTILEHKTDPREYLYNKNDLETASTHDDLWNAMQNQMVTEGKMHGWCRMYWAKKILEWTPDVQTGIDIALYLNDKYELDGLDPNGITGVMWSICGVHDRAWNERPIFGKIRYMNYVGAKRKFDIKAYTQKYSSGNKLFE